MKKDDDNNNINNINNDPQKEDLLNINLSTPLRASIINKDRQNVVKIEDSDLEFVEINENFNKKPNFAPFDEACSMCSSKIYYKKYICIICKNCILCQNCQQDHFHPMLKCKDKQLSNVYDITNYLKTHNEEIINMQNQTNKKGFFSKIFSEKYELKLDCNSLNFSMRPNKRINIPITIQNLSKTPFNCLENNIFLFARSNKDLKVYEKKVEQILNKFDQIDVNMILESNEFCKVYNFTIELYSKEEIKLKSNILSFKLEVNRDDEDEELNEIFRQYPKIIVMNKNIKKGVKKILEDKTITQDPVLVMQFLANNNGNIEETIKNLKSMNTNLPIL